MGFKLYGIEQSICTQRTLTVLEEKGVSLAEYEIYRPDMMKGEHKQKPYIDKQPFGVIPVVEDGDLTLFESRAIGRYIAVKYANQGTKLIPNTGDVKAWALFEQWAAAETSNFDAYASHICVQRVFNGFKGLPCDENIVENMIETLSKKLDIYEGILSRQDYMGGNEFSLIDIFYMPITNTLFKAKAGNLITDRPHVKAWWERVSSRQSWKTVSAA